MLGQAMRTNIRAGFRVPEPDSAADQWQKKHVFRITMPRNTKI